MFNRRNLNDSWQAKAVKRGALIVFLVIIVIYILIPNIHAFGLNNIRVLPRHPTIFVLAISIFLLVFVCSSLSYWKLAFNRLKILKILIVQFASVPLHMVLPAGVGNMSLNFLFLRTNKHNRTQSLMVIGVNNAIGVMANITIIFFLLLFFGVSSNIAHIYDRHTKWAYVLGIILALVIMAIIWMINSKLKIFNRLRKQLKAAIKNYAHRYWDLFSAYGFALLQAMITALSFYFCIKAYGININYPLSFIIYSLSVLVGALIPTPGGLGGVEASLVAALVTTHSANSFQALAAVLAYRFISLWFPMILGIFAMIVVEKKHWIRWKKTTS